MNENKTNINWYPGHMVKTKKKIKEILPLIDFVVELIDARAPYSSRITDLDDLIKGKDKIIVMTKSDLADAEQTKKWIKKYNDIATNVLAIDLKNNVDYKNLIKKINVLSDSINVNRTKKGLKEKKVRGLIIGIPNVGKSTLINKLANRKVAGVGNIPGFTKNLTWFNAGDTMLLDSPGLLWPKFENVDVALNLASISAIKTEILPIDDVAVHILKKLDKYYPQILKERYNLNSLTDDYEYNYDVISKKLGIPKQNGDIDFDRVSTFIVNDIKTEKIKGITFDREM